MGVGHSSLRSGSAGTDSRNVPEQVQEKFQATHNIAGQGATQEITNNTTFVPPAPPKNEWRPWRNNKKKFWIGVSVVVFVVLGVVPGVVTWKEMRGKNHGGSTTTNQATPSPTTSLPMSSSTTASTTASVASKAPPVPTADGVYLCDYNSSSNAANKGSVFAWYRDMKLERNVGQSPDDVAFVTTGEYAQWELANRTGIFSDTSTNFTANVNVSSEVAATLPVNAPVGYAENGNPDGVDYRSFILYKHAQTPLYNDSSGSQFWPIYYAA